MLKTIAQRSVFILALSFLAAPAGSIYAQPISSAPTTNVVTGGDPQPTGEPPPAPKPSITMQSLAAAALLALGLA